MENIEPGIPDSSQTGEDATIELTVVVDGTVISGSVVSEQAWTQRQNDQIRIGSQAVAHALAAVESQKEEPELEAAERPRPGAEETSCGRTTAGSAACGRMAAW